MELKDFCLIYYNEDMDGKGVRWSDSLSELAEEAYNSVLLDKAYHAAKILDRELKVRYLFER